MSVDGFLHLIFHLEHDGDILHTIGEIPENKISFTAMASVIVFLKISEWEHTRTHAIESVAAVSLQALAHHLVGKTSL